MSSALEAYIRAMAPVVGAELAGRFEMAASAVAAASKRIDTTGARAHAPDVNVADIVAMQDAGDEFENAMDEFSRVHDEVTAKRKAVFDELRRRGGYCDSRCARHHQPARRVGDTHATQE